MEREGQALAYPSVFPRALARVMHEHMLKHVWDHPLLLVGCFFNPLLREFEFISDSTHCTGYWSKAMEINRTLCRKQMILIERFAGRNDALSIDSSDSEDKTIRTTRKSGQQTCTQGSSSRTVGGKERSFDLFAWVNSILSETQKQDEVLRCMNCSLEHISQARKSFLEDDFWVMNFWYNGKTQFPQLFATATRVYARPVSSAAS